MQLVHFVLDESGSMDEMLDEAIKGYNDYLDQIGGLDMLFALSKFDSTKIEVVHDFVPVADALRLNRERYIPGGSTPLYDAIAHAMRYTEGAIRKLVTVDTPKIPAVLIVVLTDGLENASREYDVDKLNAFIKEKETTQGWTFLYLGAAPDAWANEKVYAGAVSADNVVHSTGARGLSASYRVAAASTADWAARASTGESATLSIVKDSDRDTIWQ